MYNLSAADLKSRVDLRDIVRRLWGDPKHESARYAVYASRWRPDGKNASFTVYATHYKDYGGSGMAGDVFAFLQEELGISFKASLEWVNSYLGGVVASGVANRPTPEPDTSHEPPPTDWQAAATHLLEQTQAYLWSDASDAVAVRRYLHEVRGFTDETIQQAGYGYNPRWAKANYINPDTGKTPKLAPGIIEPWFYDGHLWAVRVRCRVGNLAQALNIPDDTLGTQDSPKYLNLTGSRQTGALYNGDAITSGGDVLLVEGGFDTMLAQQHMPYIAAVTLGSASMHPNRDQLAHLKMARRIFLLLDNDSAGSTATAKLQSALGDKAITVTLPHGNDITDYIIQHSGNLQDLLHGAATSTVQTEAWWSDGVPDDVRSLLLTYFRPVTAPVIEMLNTAVLRGLLNPTCFTVNDVLRANDELGFGISAGSIRRVISELENYFFAKLDTIYQLNSSVFKTENKSRGRQSHYYYLLPLSQLKQTIISWAVPRIIEKLYPTLPEGNAALAHPTPEMFESCGFPPREAARIASQLTDQYQRVYDNPRIKRKLERELGKLRQSLHSSISTPLPSEWGLANGTEYRAAFLRATNDEEERRSRRKIRELVGVSNGSVGEVVRRAGLKRKEEHGEFETVPLQSSQSIERQVTDAARAVAGYPRAVVVQHPNGEQQTLPYLGEESHEVIQSQIEAGADVIMRFQVANHYVKLNAVPQPKPQPEDKPKPPRKPSAPRKTKFFGPAHDPVWVVGQLLLLLVMLERLRRDEDGDTYVDVQSGEVYQSPTVEMLLPLLL